MRILIVCFSIVFTSGIFNLNAQTKEADKYHKESEEIRKQVWAWDKAQFKVKDVPDQYSKASKVVLAHHTELTADSKSKLAFYGLGFGAKKEQSITEIVRELVKINDKTSVTEYSEMSFTQFERSSGFYSGSKATTYIGVRVIKANGSIKEINADDIVLTKDAAREKVAKVAIPDLQPGDMLDYFIATEQLLTNDMTNKPYRVFLFDDAPTLSLSFHAQLGKKYAIEYRSYNGAPELQVNKNEEKDIIVDVEINNIAPFETSLWVAPALQLPFIRMNISLGAKGLYSKYMNTKKPGEVSKNTDSEEFLEDKATSFSTSYYNGYWMKISKAEYDEIESDAKKKAKQVKISFDDMSDEEKAAQLYYTLRFSKMLAFSINKLSDKINIGSYRYNGLAFPLFCTFKAAGLQPAILISSRRTGIRMAEVMDTDDLASTTYLNNNKNFLAIETVYDVPFTAPVEIEGVTKNKSFTFDHPAMVMGIKKMMGLTKVDEGPDVPVSSSDRNAHIENLALSLTSDKTNLSVRRSTTLKGYNKADVQKDLILYEDYYESERKIFNEEKSLIEELEDDKKSKKYVEEVKNAFAEARKKQKSAFESEAKSWFEQDVTELKDYKIDNLGVRHTAPDFIYSSSFNLIGLVKKAGNNIIIEVGKIQGQPLVVKQEQRKRNLDVYTSNARSVEYNLQLEIPEGYTAEGIPALNKKVENETGFFIVEATTTDKLVTVKVKKHYLHNYEPAKNFDKMVSFMDASNEWVNAKILFKKK